jgi:hypothetical protein
MRPPRVQFSLLFVMFMFAWIAVCGTRVYQTLGLRRMVSTVVFEAIVGDEKAVARDLVSPAVLNDALSRPLPFRGSLSKLPRFAGAIDPLARLRGFLMVESDARSHTVQVSIKHGPSAWEESSEILSALGVSLVMVLGKDRVAMRSHQTSSGYSPFENFFLLILSSLLMICFHIYIRLRRKRRSVSQPSLIGPTSAGPGTSPRLLWVRRRAKIQASTTANTASLESSV